MILKKIKHTSIVKSMFVTMAASAMVFVVSCNSDNDFDDAVTNFEDQQTVLFTSEVTGDDFLTVNFRDFSLGATSFAWDFGDGNTSTEQNPTHVYESNGVFDVELTTFDANGAVIDSRIIEVSATEPETDEVEGDGDGDGGNTGGVQPTFDAVILNGGADEFTNTTGDNADAFDMTPNSKVVDNSGIEVDSPYRALWNNTELNAYIDATFGTNEQPSSTSDGAFVDGVKTRGLKLNETSRRLYQLFAVEPGVEYTVSIDTRAEAEGLNTEIFILNTEITTEVGIESFSDATLVIDNDFNASKGSETENTFTTNTITFIATSNIAVFYARSLTAVDGESEIFIDNISVSTADGSGGGDGGGPTTVPATFAAAILNGGADEFTNTTGDNADAFDMTPNSKVVDNSGIEVDSPFRPLWNNTDLNAYIDATFGTNEQPSSTSDGAFVDGVKTRGLKLNETSRRLYQLFAVEPGVEYTVSIDTRAEAEGLNTEIFILNTEITTEVGIESFSDATLVIDNDFNSSKGSETENTFTTSTITFVATSDIAVFYARSLTAVDGESEIFIDNISVSTPGF